MRAPLSRLLAFALLLCAPLHAAMVERAPLTPVLGLVQSAPAFRESMLYQIQLVTSLTAQPAPSLAPLLAAAPTPADPWRAESARLVGALVAQPQAVAQHREELRSALGDYGADLLQKATARLQQDAAAREELGAQLGQLKRGLDLGDPNAVGELGSRLNVLFENSRTSPGASATPVAAGEGPGRKPLVRLGRPGERPALTEAELDAHVMKNTVVSPRGLVRVNFAAGEYRPEYDAFLRRHGVDMVVIKDPSRAELGKYAEDDGYHLKTEYVRWVIPATSLEDLEKSMPSSRARQFRKQLKDSENVRFEIGPLTPEKFEQWYPIYEDEVVGKPGGKRNVKIDFAREQQRLGLLGFRHGLFYYDAKDPSKMLGGVIMRAWPERGLFVCNFAAYRPELKDASPSIRTFAEAMKYARSLGFDVLSLGQDTDFYGFDYNLGLMENKAGLGTTAYPSEGVILMKVLNTAKVASVKNTAGQTGGYFFFGIKRDSPLVERYLAAREAGTPASEDAEELLGGRFFTPEVLPVNGTTVGWRYKGDNPNPLRTPAGIDVIERPMAPPSEN